MQSPPSPYLFASIPPYSDHTQPWAYGCWCVTIPFPPSSPFSCVCWSTVQHDPSFGLNIFLNIPQYLLCNATRPFQKGQNILRSLLKYSPNIQNYNIFPRYLHCSSDPPQGCAWAFPLMVTNHLPKSSGHHYGHFPFPFHLSVSLLLFHSFCTK